MFFHAYKYKLKSLFREKETFFWIMFFPLILGTFFFMAFSKISSQTETFSTINVAVCADDTDDTAYFKEVIENLYADDRKEVPFFNITYTDRESADKLLSDKKADGIITVDNGNPSLSIRENGIEETVIKSFLDSYIRNMAVIHVAFMTPEKLDGVYKELLTKVSHVTEKELTKGNTDNMIDYYYSLIAMACMFATLSGTTCVTGLKADLSSVGMRKNLYPGSRITLVLGDAAATLTLHLISNGLLIIYLQKILKLNLAANSWLIYLVSVMGTIIALSISLLIGSVRKLSLNVRIGINLFISLFSSFLSGLMIGGIKQSIEKHFSLLNRLNPSALISDALYALNIYDDYKIFLQKISIMAGMAVILCIICFINTRREKYDSI